VRESRENALLTTTYQLYKKYKVKLSSSKYAVFPTFPN